MPAFFPLDLTFEFHLIIFHITTPALYCTA